MPAHTTLADAPISVPFPKQARENAHKAHVYQHARGKPKARKWLEPHKHANSFVYLAFSLSDHYKDIIVNLSGRTLTASIWTLDTAHFIKDVIRGCGVGVLEHHPPIDVDLSHCG